MTSESTSSSTSEQMPRYFYFHGIIKHRSYLLGQTYIGELEEHKLIQLFVASGFFNLFESDIQTSLEAKLVCKFRFK